MTAATSDEEIGEIARQCYQAYTDTLGISGAAGARTWDQLAGTDRERAWRAVAAMKIAYSGDDPELTMCCGRPMDYTEFAHVRRYHCTHRAHHPVVYVDQRDGTWERRSQ